MAINFNTDPYYDDYSEAKGFHRILFKPGVAVQARELNQLQTILQNQVSRFGNHVFKPGSMVIPGNIKFDNNFNYVKLELTYNNVNVEVDQYLDREMIGQTSGIRGKVINVAAATTTEPPTIFVKYLDSGTNRTAAAFSAGEVISTSDTGTTYYATVNSTGKCQGASISDGVYFVKDNFVKVFANTIVLDKYLSNSNYKIGLEVSESIKNSEDDESLLDPAIGTYNYFAPGADRYKIELILSKRTLTDATSSDNFIELLRVVNGSVVDIVDKPGYNVLQDELARRTYDESGDYTVKPFNLKFVEHAKSIDNPDGFLNGNEGGNVQLALAVLSPGKSYVKGYEVSTISNRYLSFAKPRDTDNVTNAVVRTPVGNYVEITNPYAIPNFTSNLIDVNLYNQYTATPGSAAGTLVGNAKIRGFESTSSNAMLTTSTFKSFLFDVNMVPGYTFDRDVKQLYHASVSDTGYVSTAFTSNIVPSTTSVVTGTVNLTNASNTVTGVNSVFTTDLKAGDYIKFNSDTSNSYRVISITTNSALVIDRVYPLSNVSGTNATRDQAVIVDNDLSSYIFPMPNIAVKELSDITIRTRRVSYGTLSTGNIALSTAVGTTFASRTDQNYFAIVVSGGNAGKLFAIDSGKFAFTDAPANRNININLTAYGLTNEDVLIYTTIIKTNPSAKSKTVTANSATYTTVTDCQAKVVSLGVADAYEISNVRMSANAFGTAYSESNSFDISDYYTLETGQTPTYYGISKVKLKPGKPLPTGPIKINFNYYTHGTGDYFSVESYPSFENIPNFNDNGTVYDLRSSIDLRPRISNDGANFKNTGAVRTEFLDYANDFNTDYSYYLPRIDKIYLSGDGKITYKEGSSSLNPIEPQAPSDAMSLYVIEHPAYGFDINNDSTFYPVDQKRYTMKDIGKLENRIKNLEYYTTLSLLELDTAIFSVKDSFGLDRFKNGFVVDSFRGHGIGDVRNLDYNISMDFEKGELKPAFVQKNLKLNELEQSTAGRAANGYVIKDNRVAMLSYSDEEYIVNSLASSTESINPFDNYTFAGSVVLDPPGDSWYDQTTKPLIYKDDNGTYDTLIPDSVGEATYGSIWNSWKQVWYSPTNTDKVKAIEGGAVITDASVTGSSTSVIFPYVRSASIKFSANKLKPNTKLNVFFNEYNVTGLCYSANTTANVVASFGSGEYNQSNIITDDKGTVYGVFNFDVATTGLKIPAGKVNFRLTDSDTNGADKETFADAVFNASGVLSKIEPPRVPYNPPVTYSPVTEVAVGDGDSGSDAYTTVTSVGFAEYAAAFLKGVDIASISPTDATKYASFYQSALASAGVTEAQFIAQIDNSPVAAGTTTYRNNSTADTTFSFKSGPAAADSSIVLANGMNITEYLTATNVLDARSGTGSYFIDDLKTEVGDTYWNSVVLPVYEGTRAAVTEAVKNNEPTTDMLSFYQAGIANGSWTDTGEGIEKAINNYAAAISLSVIEAPTTTNYIVAGGTDGLLGTTTTIPV
jgi:hypothetical protein